MTPSSTSNQLKLLLQVNDELFVQLFMPPYLGLSFEGIASEMRVTRISTLQWQVTDNGKVIRTVLLTNYLYAKGLLVQLLSPQHWYQVSNDSPNGTYFITKQKLACTLVGMATISVGLQIEMLHCIA